MFEIINNYGNDIGEIEILNKYISFVVEKLSLDNCVFNVIFINDEEIRNLNKTYRDIDRKTDVISFALEDYNDNIKDSIIRVLGDIYISIDTAYEQASMYGHSKEREVCFLTTHGILHLLGYDHMEEDDEKIMFEKQEELLNEYGLQR